MWTTRWRSPSTPRCSRGRVVSAPVRGALAGEVRSMRRSRRTSGEAPYAEARLPPPRTLVVRRSRGRCASGRAASRSVRVFRFLTHGSPAFSDIASNLHFGVFQLFRGPIIKAFVISNAARTVRWKQRSIERLRQTLRYLQRLLAVDRPPEALALIPIRAARPHGARQRHQRAWRG